MKTVLSPLWPNCQRFKWDPLDIKCENFYSIYFYSKYVTICYKISLGKHGRRKKKKVVYVFAGLSLFE